MRLQLLASCFLFFVASLSAARADDLYVAATRQGYINSSSQIFRNPPATNGPGPVFIDLGVGFPNHPGGMAFDSQGNLYVSEIQKPTIEKFAPDGSYLGPFVANTQGRVYGLAFDAADNLYAVVETAIQMITPNGVVSTFAGRLTGPSPGLEGPRDLAFDSAGNLYVANSGSSSGSITKFSNHGIYLQLFATNLNYPYSLAFDAVGRLYVATFDSIERFDPTGNALGIFATIPSCGNGVLAIAFDGGGNLMVARCDKVYQVTPDGTVSERARGFDGPVGGGPNSLALRPGLLNSPPPAPLPLLNVGVQPGQIRLSWSTNSNPNFGLVGTSNFASGIWASVSDVVSTSGENYVVILTSNSANRFFRLRSF